MRVLVTGGAGFIGMNLVRTLLAKQHEVIVIDDLTTGHRDNLDGLDINFVEASILDERALQTAVRGADTIVHLAALGSVPRSLADPMRSHEVNATGTLRVLQAATGASVGHVIVASSSSVYGMNPALPKAEREWVRPMSPYAVTKLATEQYALAFQQSFGLDTLAFRFFNVYGPGQRPGHPYAAVIPVFIDALLAGNPLPVNGDGLHSRDFTFVETVCRVLTDGVERRVSHAEPVNLAFGTNTTLLELIRELGVVSATEPRIAHRDPRPGDVRHSRADNTVLRELFPQIEPVHLSDGLSETYKWLEERHR